MEVRVLFPPTPGESVGAAEAVERGEGKGEGVPVPVFPLPYSKVGLCEGEGRAGVGEGVAVARRVCTRVAGTEAEVEEEGVSLGDCV